MNRYNRYYPPCAPVMHEQRPPAGMMPAVQGEGGAGMPLAVPFVQWQRWGCVYEPDMALRQGTVFPELDLPFCGSGVRRG